MTNKRTSILVATIIIALGLLMKIVEKTAQNQIPFWLQKYGLIIWVLLSAFLIIFSAIKIIIDKQSGKQDKEQIKDELNDKKILDENELLKMYLTNLLEEVSLLNLSGIDPTIAADPKMTPFQLASIYIDLETLQAENKRMPVIEMMNKNQYLVLLGDPGSGKSTFINFITCCLAGEKLSSEYVTLSHLGTSWTHNWLLPVRVVLRDFVVRGMLQEKEKNNSEQLVNFLKTELKKDLVSFAPILHKYLEKGKAIILLDGFDEVPDAYQNRKQIIDILNKSVEEFPRCRFLLTSRTYAWERQEWKINKFSEAKLASFTEQQIETFIDRWYKHSNVQKRSNLSPEDAQGKAALLKYAILHNQRLTELARRPLLLTLMSSLHAWQGGDLPEKREELYDKSLELLLYIWERSRIVRDSQGKEKGISPAIIEWLKTDRRKLLSALEQIGYEAHAEQLTYKGTADIQGDVIGKALWKIRGDPDLKLDRVMEYIQNRAGLLIQRGVDTYTFHHRSFQEYLAARFLTNTKSPEEIAALVKKEPERWQEVVLLAIAKVARGFKHSAWLLIESLAPVYPSKESFTINEGWAAYIAAISLVENGLHKEVPDEFKDKLKKLQKWLVVILEKNFLPPVERASAGNTLSYLGDLREGVTTLPPMLSEIIQSKDLEPFQVGIYPITNAQFKRFVDDGGYKNFNWWSEAGVMWLKNPPLYRKKAIQPDCWNFSHLNSQNQPVVGISYYEAEAFCRWLSVTYRREYRLPTEEEWILMAGGKDKTTYPWGNKWKSNISNTHESGIGQTSAVGIFPDGRSSTGAYDCSGNIWEWCSSYHDQERKDIRVVHGGAWNSERDMATCFFIREVPSADCDHFTGFRLVSSPATK